MNFQPPTTFGSPEMERGEGQIVTDELFRRLLVEMERDCIAYPRTSTPFILMPMGLIASGKTTVVRHIAEHYGLVVVRTDTIREFLGEHGYQRTRTPEFAFHLVRMCVERGYGVAIDADVVMAKDRAELAEAAAAWGMSLVSIHIVTPESIILSRLDAQNPDREYKGQEAQERYKARKVLHEGVSFQHQVVINGAEELEPQLRRAYEVIDTYIADASRKGRNQNRT